jgi:hypothetical protein
MPCGLAVYGMKMSEVTKKNKFIDEFRGVDVWGVGLDFPILPKISKLLLTLRARSPIG